MESLLILWFYIGWWILGIFAKGLVIISSKPPIQVFVELFWADSMLGFDVVWNIEVVWKKSGVRGQKFAFLGNPAKWYRYPLTEPKWYRYLDKVVPVPTYKTGLVLVPNIVVPIPMLPIALILVLSHH